MCLKIEVNGVPEFSSALSFASEVASATSERPEVALKVPKEPEVSPPRRRPLRRKPALKRKGTNVKKIAV